MHIPLRKKIFALVICLMCTSGFFFFNQQLFYNENYQCPKNVITVKPMGDLCNQILEYMSLYVVWKENEMEFRKYNYGPYIDSIMKTNIEDVFMSISIPTFDECNKTGRTPKKIPISNKGPAVIPEILDRSWYQLPDYTARYEAILEFGFENIRKELRFRDSIVNEVQTKLHQLSKKYPRSTFVCMHYRGGDYIEHLTQAYGKHYRGPPDYRYYQKAMDFFKERYKNVVFLLVTSDLYWLKKNIAQIANYGIVKVNPTKLDRDEDIVLLSSCNHSIINYGTFGVVTSLFANGTTIVYDLGIPLDYRGQTVGMGITNIMPDKWFLGNDTNIGIKPTQNVKKKNKYR